MLFSKILKSDNLIRTMDIGYKSPKIIQTKIENYLFSSFSFFDVPFSYSSTSRISFLSSRSYSSILHLNLFGSSFDSKFEKSVYFPFFLSSSRNSSIHFFTFKSGNPQFLISLFLPQLNYQVNDVSPFHAFPLSYYSVVIFHSYHD